MRTAQASRAEAPATPNSALEFFKRGVGTRFQVAPFQRTASGLELAVPKSVAPTAQARRADMVVTLARTPPITSDAVPNGATASGTLANGAGRRAADCATAELAAVPESRTTVTTPARPKASHFGPMPTSPVNAGWPH